MTEKERTGNPEIPQWWWDKARPILKEVRHADVVAQASKAAGRDNPWGQDAISKFLNDKDPRGRTVALTNALSDVLQIPRPFYTAPSEEVARKMHVMAATNRATPVLDDKQAAKLASVDVRIQREHRDAIDQTHGVSSPDEVEGADRDRRARRAARRRP